MVLLAIVDDLLRLILGKQVVDLVGLKRGDNSGSDFR